MNHPPFTLVGLDHVVFLVDDMAQALAFYHDVLGCVPGYSYPDLGMQQVWCGAALIVLWDTSHANAPDPRDGRNVDHICIATSPFDPATMRAHLKTHNVVVEREAHHGGARGMGTSFYIRDPFGNTLEVKGPAEYPDGRTAD
jgi:glyoxylase I family protein